MDTATNGRRSADMAMLWLATSALFAAFTLEIRRDQLVEFRFLRGLPLPELCASRSLFKVECPGCGLTRSVVSLANGDWGQSTRYHRLGWLAAIGIVIQIPYRLATWRRPKIRDFIRPYVNPLGYALIIAFFFDWAAR